YRQKKDHDRDEILRNIHFHVLRIKNDELEDINKVLGRIEEFISIISDL
ncbi:MAG: DUF559 domain-containing protein, partial [Calditrichaeota bacterium]